MSLGYALFTEMKVKLVYSLHQKRFGKKVYWLTLLCVQKWKIFGSTKLTFSSFTTNLALALKVLFYKEKLES